MDKRGKDSRDEQGCWEFGGGGLEFGDKVEDTIRKEVREEYGTDVLDYEFIGYRDVHRKQGKVKTHWIALDFLVKVDRLKAKNGEPGKIDEIGWFTLGNLPSPLQSQTSVTLELLKKKLS